MAVNPLAAALNLTPQEAVDYFRARGQLAQSFNWQDVYQEEHAQQFTVSRLANLDLLQSVYDGLLKSVQGDLSRRDWTRNAELLLREAGWWGKKEVLDPATGEMVTTTFDPPRLKLIFDVNTRVAHAAGQWQRIERNKQALPYIRYITRRDERVRASHRAWDNVTLPVDDPFWKTHFPPNGWRCRCRAMSITQAEYDAGLSPNGERLIKTAPDVQAVDWVNKRTGVIEKVPVGIDPGFAYNPGMAGARQAKMAEVEAQKLSAVNPVLREAYNAEMKNFKQPEGGVFNAPYNPHISRVRPDTSTPARSTAVEVEDRIRFNAFETGAFVDASGNILLERAGAAGSVPFTNFELFRMGGATFTHNHTRGGSFSCDAQDSDLWLAFVWQFSEVRATTGQFRYIASPVDGVWPLADELLAMYPEADKYAEQVVIGMVMDGNLDYSYKQIEKSHQIVLYLSRKLGFNYLRETS